MSHDHDHGHDHGHDHPGRTFSGDVAFEPGAPLVIEVTRGNMVESRHRAIAVIVDADARVIEGWGDIDRPVMGRSAIKALQAIPLVETGAADAFQVTDEEIALACASHKGEAIHADTARRWLERVGLSVDDYECGVHLPYDEGTAHELIRRGEAPTQAHNNCSGKHAGFLTTARHMGEPTKGYVRREHPVQQRVMGVLEQMTGTDLSHAPWGIDGCGIPTIGIPLSNTAFGMARLANPKGLPDRRKAAIRRITRAWSSHPYMISGRDSFDTALTEIGQGRFMVKIGAEGVHCAAIPALGYGIALKIEDGAARAATVAMAHLLRRLGLVDDAAWETLREHTHPPIRNRAGREVGEIRAENGSAA